MNNKTNNNLGNFYGPVTTTTPTHEELKQTEIELKEKEVVKTGYIFFFESIIIFRFFLNQSYFSLI
jgi:hypothetical protein